MYLLAGSINELVALASTFEADGVLASGEDFLWRLSFHLVNRLYSYILLAIRPSEDEDLTKAGTRSGLPRSLEALGCLGNGSRHCRPGHCRVAVSLHSNSPSSV